MLARVLEQRHEVAAFVGVPIADDPYLFSHAADSSTPMSPGYLTTRVALLKSHLGIEVKQPATVARSAAVAVSREQGNELTFLVALADDWPQELYRRLGFEPAGLIHRFRRPARGQRRSSVPS